MNDLTSISSLVTARREQAVCSSLMIAEHFYKRHKNVIQTIETKILPAVSKEFGRLNFQPSSYVNSQNKKQPMYYMTRDGFTLLVMGFTGKEAMEWKIKYINAFNSMEKLLKERSTPEFLELREQGKTIRRIETDAIKEFVEYAKSQGSKHAHWYYKSFSSMVNKAAKVKNRTEAGEAAEEDIQLMEQLIARRIHKGIKAGQDYKAIYKDCERDLQIVS